MGRFSKAYSFSISCCLLLFLLPLPDIPYAPSPFPDDSIIIYPPPKEFANDTAVKTLTNIPWMWEQYEQPPSSLPGDDVLHWGSDLGPFHNYSEIVDHLNDRVSQFPEQLNLFTIGESYNGLPIPCISITGSGDSSDRLGFLIVAHHHGREAITIENALFFLDYLLAFPEATLVENALNNFIFYLIPTLNPDALEILHINPWQRKNLHPTDEDADGLLDEWEVQDTNGDFMVEQYEEEINGTIIVTYEGVDLDADGETGEDLPGGIDLNRNYPIAFDEGVSDPRSEIYHGQSPFSEPETQAMLNFTQHHHSNLVFGLSLHSGTAVFLTPWGHTSEPSYHEPYFARLGAYVELASGYDWWSATQLYPTYGSWEDWLYGEYGVPAATLETYGDASAYVESIWDYFNPSANQVIPVCRRVRDAILAITSVLLDEPGNPVIITPVIVPSLIPAWVSVYITESLSGFEILTIDYSFDGVSWQHASLIYQGGNRYDALVPSPLFGSIVHVQVSGQDFADHQISSNILSYQVSFPLLLGISCAIVSLILVLIWLVLRRHRRTSKASQTVSKSYWEHLRKTE